MQAHMWTKVGLDVFPDRMLLASQGCTLIKPEIRTQLMAPFLSLSMQSQHSSKYKVCSTKRPYIAGSKLHSEKQTHHELKALTRRVLLLQFWASFETVMFKKSLLVKGSARADEQSSDSPDGPRGDPTAEVVLQGLPFTARLARPIMSSMSLSEEDDEPVEVLSVKLTLLRRKASAFHVFVNLPDANEQTPITSFEYAGSYFHEPRRVKNPEFELQQTLFRIGIGDVIKDLGLMEQSSIPVTFVPCGIDKDLPVVLESLYIELE